MTVVRREALLAAPADVVFGFITDPANFEAYVAGYERGRVLSERSTGMGSAFEWVSHLGPLAVHAREQVVEWEVARRVVYEGHLAGVPFQSRMEVSEREAGCALAVTIDYTLPAALGGRLAEAALRPLVERDVRVSLAKLVGRFGNPSDVPSEDALVALYRRRAGTYDKATQLYRMLGFRLETYRRMAVDELELSPGATVVEIGCGTGANFELLEERVGPRGRIIGVDLTDAMLEKAAAKARRRGWTNVELVRSDAADFDFPFGIDGILSTLALTHCPSYDRVIEKGAASLTPEGRWVLLDLKLPDGWPSWAVSAGLAVARPYGVTLGAAARKPWESLERHLGHTRVRELYFGIAYLAAGWRGN